MSEPIGKLAAKLLRVVKATTGVPKTGWNAFHKYHYTTEEDLIVALRKPLTEAGLAVFFSCDGPPTDTERPTRNGTTVVTTVAVRFTVIDSESGESMTGVVYGRGEDPTDKGVYKAYTGAQKYFLQKLFMLSTGDDPERDGEAQETPKAESKPRQAEAKRADPAPAKNGNGSPPATPDQLKEISTLADLHELDFKGRADLAIALRKGMDNELATKTIAWLKGLPLATETV